MGSAVLAASPYVSMPTWGMILYLSENCACGTFLVEQGSINASSRPLSI